MSKQIAVLTLIMTTLATPGIASEFCMDIKALIRAASSEFSSGATAVGHPLTGLGECTVALTLGAPDAHICHWGFDYRAPEAKAAFKEFNAGLQACFDGTDQIKDQGVNHPDFYDLRQYRLANAQVSVSIKDKGALQQTFVFLRVESLE